MALFNITNPQPTYQGTPFIKVTIGEVGGTKGEVFTTGDGRLKTASVQLGEGKLQSNCSFSVYDPDKKLVDKFLTYIESVGGLDPVADEVSAVEAPTVESAPNTTAAPALGNTGNYTQDASLPNEIRAFLDALHFAENDGYGKLFEAGGYNVMFSGLTFSSYADHPRRRFAIGSTFTTAAGRYQFIDTTWDSVRRKLKLPDFSPVSQDRGAVELIRERGAYNDIISGRISSAIAKLNGTGPRNNLWSSLPGGGQQRKTFSQFNTYYQQRLAAYRQLVKPTSTGNPATTAATNRVGVNVSKNRIGDWALPKLPATKTIIVFPGHLADTPSTGGTSGTESGTVLYKGEQRIREFVANDIVTSLLITGLQKAGYRVITAPPTPTERGNAARTAYYNAVEALKDRSSAYAVEIHFDEPRGRSGVIPGGKYDQSGASLNVMDVFLAREFGHFSFNHRRALGGPSRGITLLEIDALNSTLTGLVDNAVSSNNFSPLEAALKPYVGRILKSLNLATNTVGNALANNTNTVGDSQAPGQEQIPESRTLAGAQITIELGFDGKTIAASSFIHTGLEYSLFAPDILEFTGQAATWVLTQRVKNTVYTNLTFKKVAEKITSAYGLKLDMPEEGPKYEYFPQRGISDYEALLIEARRIGYRVHVKGATLSIKPRDKVIANKEVFTFIYGENMGTSFEVKHQAQKDSSGGARSSEPGSNNSTGERKFEVDPDSGKIVQKRLENVVGTGDSGDTSTTGSTTPTPKPKTEGSTDAVDADRKAGEDRVKGITASTEFPTTPEALTLDPDTPFLTKGISTFLDRMWVVESVTHTYDLGKLNTSIDCYSPIKNKNASADITTSAIGSSPALSPDGTGVVKPSSGYIIPAKGKFTSPHGMRGGRMHNGIDIANRVGTPIVAAAAGTVTTVVSGCTVGNKSCGGGFGNYIILRHSNGDETVYAHNSRNLVLVNDSVSQGQQIALMGNTGNSTGPHLHWEVRRNGNRINPASVVKLPPLGSSIFVQ